MLRRSFLKKVGLGASIAAIPGFLYTTTSLKDAVTGIITNELGYLKLDKAGVDRFADDYLKTVYSQSTPLKLKTYYFLGRKAEQSWLINDVVSRYLLSSDYFLNKMDEGKIVKYTTLYNPYLNPCSNPFSSLYYPVVAT